MGPARLEVTTGRPRKRRTQIRQARPQRRRATQQNDDRDLHEGWTESSHLVLDRVRPKHDPALQGHLRAYVRRDDALATYALYSPASTGRRNTARL